jgi:hypothetical protein
MVIKWDEIDRVILGMGIKSEDLNLLNIEIFRFGFETYSYQDYPILKYPDYPDL